MRIHFIGVGKMGLPMAALLKAAGHHVTVSDIDPERLRLAREQGLAVAAKTRPSLDTAAFVISSLPDDEALHAVASHVASAAQRGAVYVETSTVSEAASADVAALCESAGIEYLRATLSGNNKMAEAAQLTVMVSGPRAAYERALPLLAVFGPTHFYLGAGEEARLMKLVVNLMIAQTSAMLAEALTLGRKGGLDWREMWQVICASAVGSPVIRSKALQLAERDFTPTFTVTQMTKDLGLILQAGEAHQVPLPQAALTYQLMQAAIAQGSAEEDYAAVIKAAERSAGLGNRP